MTSSKCPIEKIVKRDGNIVDYNRERIATAIFKAAAEVGGRDREMAEFLAKEVEHALVQASFPRTGPPSRKSRMSSKPR